MVRRAHSILSMTAVVAPIVALAGAAVLSLGSGAQAGPPMSMSMSMSMPTNGSVVIPRDAMDHGYATPVVTVSQDGVLSVVNLDSIDHTVTADATDASGLPLFSVRVLPGATTTVPIAGLAAGSYGFHCMFHPSTMRATLVVTGGSSGAHPVPPHFDQPLAIPRVLTGRHVRLVEREVGVRVMPTGPLTRMWTYGGSYPGPTIRRRTGHEMDVTVVNRLPARVGSTSMHLHGDHHASQYDGLPTGFLVHHGQARTYRFPLTEAGRPEPASFFWYHDHRMNVTGRNNRHGLQGMFITDDPAERGLHLPSGPHDVPLMISETSLDANNQLVVAPPPRMSMTKGAMSWSGPSAPPHDAVPGDRVLVNGRFAPFLDVSATRYRLRLLNASAFSIADLSLSDGRPLVQIGTGDGLLPHPAVRPSIPLGPAQRAEVVVDFHGLQGQSVLLQSAFAPIMEFRVGAGAADTSRVPYDLPSPRLVRAPRHVSHVWYLGLGHGPGGRSFWSIDGRPFDPARADVTVPLDSVQRWRIVNDTHMTHVVHLHEELWRTVLRDGRPPPPWERGLEDTWVLAPGESIDVAARFSDYTGLFMLHCHMLDHEDHGLMAQFRVARS